MISAEVPAGGRDGITPQPHLLLNNNLLKLLWLKERTQENLRRILVQPQQQQGIEIAPIRVCFLAKDKLALHSRKNKVSVELR